jgi:hypothetical protein
LAKQVDQLRNKHSGHGVPFDDTAHCQAAADDDARLERISRAARRRRHLGGAPTLPQTVDRQSHHRGIAGSIEREMSTTPRDPGDLVEYLVGPAIDDVGSAELPSGGEALFPEVNGYDRTATSFAAITAASPTAPAPNTAIVVPAGGANVFKTAPARV